MFYVGEFRANLVVYRFCEVLSYKKWTLGWFTIRYSLMWSVEDMKYEFKVELNMYSKYQLTEFS